MIEILAAQNYATDKLLSNYKAIEGMPMIKENKPPEEDDNGESGIALATRKHIRSVFN